MKPRRSLWKLFFPIFIALALLVAIFTLASPAYAATIIVDNDSDGDDGECAIDCSLREAIDTAAGGDTITFAGDFIITLGSQLSIAKELTIDGSGHSITVDGDNSVRVFVITSSGVVTLSHLTVANGTHASAGGGIYNEGALVVSNSTFSGNFSDFGGGIFNQGIANIIDCGFDNNTATTDGGGVFNYSPGEMTVTGSTISYNTANRDGGGIDNNSLMTVANSTIDNNNVPGSDGGGIHNSGSLTVTYSIIENNTANDDGGGVADEVDMRIMNSVIRNNTAGNWGGGLFPQQGSQMEVINSVIDGNQAASGGGIYIYSYLPDHLSVFILIQSTVSNNTATNEAGGIAVHPDSTATIMNSTISGNIANNRAGGIGVQNGLVEIFNSTISHNTGTNAIGGVGNNSGTVNLSNTILSNNTNDNCAGLIASLGAGFNLDSDNSCILSGTQDISGIDPRLGLLQNNDGPLTASGLPPFTRALLPGSPAIDFIPTTDASCNPGASVDQRGAARANGPSAGGIACDIGAFEVSDQTPNALPLVAFSANDTGTRLLSVTAFLTTLLLTFAIIYLKRRSP